ncbi:GH1 family beta-glucosidase [Vibrio hippocampi]|uniref:Beta-glucosidase n=1 Tax=Vibrio hippocampi TaxID=654686 RepID=A0ABN8DL27_9VIBR|nr:GH1 family beta-glucosidase [Vibrio hippocampi]CAH0528847.1 Beta-glucosidase B [Vibrio hippocampi]
MKYQIPADSKLIEPNFVFGVATSSYQIEGGVREGGRTPSIWDTFCRKAGVVNNFDNGDVACDHYHLWQHDIAMIADLGVDAYRLSVSWSRILPQDGVVNPQGLEFYSNIIDECHRKGLKVYVTLYHWDLPQYLEDKGGWLNRETAYKFAQYADVVSQFFGHKIDVYTTLNEPFVSAFLGYRWGIHAPGVKGDKQGFQAAHHLMLAHGLAMPVLRRNAPNSLHGLVVNVCPAYPVNSTDVAAAEFKAADGYLWFIDPVFTGQYPEVVCKKLVEYMPLILEGDMEIISAPLDYLGINYYSREVIGTNPDGQPEIAPQTEAEHTFIGWEVYPRGLTDVLVLLKQRYANLPPMYITENGAACDDEQEGGVIHDDQRIAYYQTHLTALDEAIRQGVDIRGYFAWSLMDNFEWAFGYSQRFGIVHVDYQTQERTLKNSALAFRGMLKQRKKTISSSQ